MSDLTGLMSESAARLELARELAGRCPASFGGEIALTGSAALGVADARSDVELNFWAEELPGADARRIWLREIGADEVALDVEVGPDGTTWSTWRSRGLWVEAGWQTMTAHDRNVAALLSGTVVDPERLAVAGATARAVTLRSAGRLAAWQRDLASYPPGLTDRIVRAAVQRWQWPHWVALRWAYLERGERLAHAGCLVGDMRAAVRVLLAVNRRWESGWKWLRPACRDLERKPARLLERIDSVLTERDDERAIRSCLALVLDCLALAPPLPEVERARTLLGESLGADGLRRAR